jgi:hypothetical protein
MLTDITAPDLTVLFFGIVFCLGVALVWMFCELERYIAPQSRMITKTMHRRSTDREMRD